MDLSGVLGLGRTVIDWCGSGKNCPDSRPNSLLRTRKRESDVG